MKPRIKIEICVTSPEVRSYCVTAVLATSKGDLFKFPLSRGDAKPLKKIGQVARDVLDALDSLAGLEEEVKKPKKKYCRCRLAENPQTCLMASRIHEEISGMS